MKSILKAAVAASALMLAQPAWSNIVEATPSDENGILVHGTGPVQEDQVVEGQLGIGGQQVNIGDGDTSAPADEYRMQQGQGQATVTGAEISGNDYYDMQSMNIWLDDGTNYSWIELSLFGDEGADLHFILTDNFGATFDFYGELLDGETKFAFTVEDDQLIANLFWEVTDGVVTTVKQIRIDPGVAGPAVPEPSTWAMMLMGFGAAGYAMRRRRRDGNKLAQVA